MEEEVLGGITEDERVLFMQTLEKICGNMTNMEDLQ